jgi:hypothetical protein
MTVTPVTVHVPGSLGPLLLIAMVGLALVFAAFAMGHHLAFPLRRTRDDQ